LDARFLILSRNCTATIDRWRRLDHDEIGSTQSNFMKRDRFNTLERDAGEKPVSTLFSSRSRVFMKAGMHPMLLSC
jgi:hypothetical protein